YGRLARFDEIGHRRAADGRKRNQLAARQAGWQQMIRIGGRQQEHGVWRRLLERFQKAVLRLLRHALGIGQQGHAERRYEGLQAQKLLEGLLVRRRTAFRMKPELVDADCLGTVVRPEVRMDLETRWLSITQQQFLGERACDGGLADCLLADQTVGMRQAAGPLVSPKDRDGAVVARDRRKTASNSGGSPTSSRGWHGAHLNKSFLDDAGAPLLSCWRFRQRSCQLVGIVAFRPTRSQFTS